MQRLLRKPLQVNLSRLNLLKKLKQLQNPSQSPQSNNLENSTNDSSNTTTPSTGLTFFGFSQAEYTREIFLYRTVSISVCILLVLFFVLNAFLNSRLNTLKNQLDTKVSEVDAYAETENDYTKVVQGLESYKEVLATRSSVYNKMLVAYDQVPDSIDITALSLTPTDFTIDMYGADLLEFSKFIELYLRSPLIASITLQGASLSPSSGGYIVDIKGTFK